MDSLPVLSQVKSLFQAAAGDVDGARKTQENFSRRCPVISQARSAVEFATGDTEGARETQLEFLGEVGNLADGVPVVGHIKGSLHYAAGDKEGGDKAMKSASRTTGVVAGGAIGMAIGGPVGAVAGGVVGGATMDGITTGVESTIEGEYRPAGHIANVTQLVENPNDAGQWFETLTAPVMDGMAGYGAGKSGTRINPKAGKIKLVKSSGKAAVKAIRKNCGMKQIVKKYVRKATVKEFNEAIKKAVSAHNNEKLIDILCNDLGISKEELSEMTPDKLNDLAETVINYNEYDS